MNYLVDVAILILFLVVAATGFYMYLFIPSGVQGGRYQVYAGLTKATWTLIHNRVSILLTIAIIIHIVLHSRWIVCTTRAFRKKSADCDNTRV
jgi:cytochrome b subunit of formate dehydrogenase